MGTRSVHMLSYVNANQKDRGKKKILVRGTQIDSKYCDTKFSLWVWIHNASDRNVSRNLFIQDLYFVCKLKNESGIKTFR